MRDILLGFCVSLAVVLIAIALAFAADWIGGEIHARVETQTLPHVAR